MNRKTLQQLYSEHSGKVSDKWSLYLSEYDRLFCGYRDKPVRLFEIGIQNGGSLEIWSKYFDNASVLIGCDINPDCARLTYSDPRISVIVGDANVSKISDSVLQRCPQFDIVIDDGSHLSSDIVRSFALYFPRLVEGGLFVAEDLHCSYWSQLQGGLFDPYSSISFFKRLADVINHEHWGISKTRADILRGIFAKYSCEVDDEVLSQVHSVEFINSMCVIRKATVANNGLGHRIISGSLEMVVSGHKKLQGLPYEFSSEYDQYSNLWSARPTPPDEDLQHLETQITERDIQVASLNQIVTERDIQVASLNQIVTERDIQVASLNQIVTERDIQVASLNQLALRFQNSTSWWLTKPVKVVGIKIKKIKKILVTLNALLSNIKELKKISIKIWSGGSGNTEHHLKLFQSEEYFVQVARDRGLQPEFLRALIIFGTVFLKIRQWLTANKFFLNNSELLSSFFLSKTEVLRKVALTNLRVHLDKPKGFFKIVDESFVISGWGVNLQTSAAANVRVRIGKVIHPLYATPRPDVLRAFASVCELPPEVGFVAMPVVPVGLHRMSIEVASPDGIWIPVRHIVLLRKPWSTLEERPGGDFRAWTRIEQKQLEMELPNIARHIDVMLHKPKFTVVIDTRKNLYGWEKSLQSIRNQIYPHYELRTLLDVGGNLPPSLEEDAKPVKGVSLADVGSDYIVFIESGQSLSSNALYEFANAINQYPDIDLIYGDEVRLNANGEQCNPFYKPDWSPDYLETFNYIGFAACFRMAVVCDCFYNAHLYDLTLRVTERTTKIWHVAKILGHGVEGQTDNETLGVANSQNILALQGRLDRTGRHGTVLEHELHRGCYDIEVNLKYEPLVSIIIPTAGKTVTVEGREIDLIVNVVDQILNRSTYKNIEIIVVDNGDLVENQMRKLSDYKCQRITYTEPVFNISKKLNLGATIAKGELLLLMNDDIEILSPSWINRMVEHFEKPHVGVVGAKLLYPNGRTQHVGVVHNNGNPDHVRCFYPGNEAGYYFSTCGVRNYMAVTGAVMMTSSNIYRELGGYSEELAVSYNDADYCLKVQGKGLSIVYAPKVELTHMESLSRVPTADFGEVAWYHQRWAAQTVSDPFYNEQFLTVASPTFVPYVNQRKL
jgi:GT2 family glycosyltransferase